MLSIDLNCDMGEGMLTDEEIMPFISSANIACGYHAGSDETIRSTIASAKKYNVAIGAHPGFADKENFGRKKMHLPVEEIYHLVVAQITVLQNFCNEADVKLHHVKPHGALYNMAARDAYMAKAIVAGILHTDGGLQLYGLSGSYLITEAEKLGVRTVSEVFADRTYQADGSLTGRDQPNAMISDAGQAVRQVMQLIESKKVTIPQGKTISIEAETICLHGDGEHAVEFATAIHHHLQQKNIAIACKK